MHSTQTGFEIVEFITIKYMFHKASSAKCVSTLKPFHLSLENYTAKTDRHCDLLHINAFDISRAKRLYAAN